MAPGPQPGPPDKVLRRLSLIRCVIALCILLSVAFYSLGIVAGVIPPQRRLVGADVAILLIGVLITAVLLRPEILDRLTHFKLGSLEFELQKLQSNQKSQQNELNDVRFALTLLVQDRERDHLANLESGETKNYVGNHDLRTDVRRLRTLGLLANVGDRKVADIKDGQQLDLARFVQLTERGRQYLEKLREGDQESLDGQ